MVNPRQAGGRGALADSSIHGCPNCVNSWSMAGLKKKSEILSFRVTREEKKKLMELLHRRGKTVGDLFRTVVEILVADEIDPNHTQAERHKPPERS